jgi:hypothetical protein
VAGRYGVYWDDAVNRDGLPRGADLKPDPRSRSAPAANGFVSRAALLALAKTMTAGFDLPQPFSARVVQTAKGRKFEVENGSQDEICAPQSV